MKIQCVLFNYNLPKQTDDTYNVLINNNFDPKHIIVVDNGSDKAPLALSTNLSLPFNVRFSGQANTTLQFLMTYRPSDYYLLITTSAKLDQKLDYFHITDHIINELSASFGVVMASLIGGETEQISPEQSHDDLTRHAKAYRSVYSAQPIMTLVSHQLLSICYKKRAAYFNTDLKRGHGIDIELQHIALTHGLTTFVSRDLWVHWKTNQAHKLNLADESAYEYRCQAQAEMEKCFAKRYGEQWEKHFRLQFAKKTNSKIKITTRNQYKFASLRQLWYGIKLFIFKCKIKIK
ncbi:hypothetical protein [Photobacterium aquimaris]|uniref:Glycosyl transferase family 2 n=1 Tax=Photobacterium aquimaris TaxID=512643 RepID=A0A1Y6KW77_9GAMM|nr:hypothetical protein [Photobacterium aquimaris]SMY16433.1 hypothetical protein PAQU9191_01664 [Photobacterium aquimaris]